MPEPAIRVENLGKLYRIGRAHQRHDTLREALVAGLQAPRERLRANRQELARAKDTIWALRNVFFDVQRGEVVGIIGHNGAGKSTLLKILSRITEPTEGRATIRGRVGSLLEVGTGFHPELTGRENIYLSGAILGMRKVEIDKRFDEIVDFAEIAEFVDTPVKRYSSGMHVRLGFAVAAHLEPEILLVDEVLAVGDAAFQRKCLGKIENIAGEDRTVLFVSHNLAAVQELCTRGIYLRHGAVWTDDVAAKTVTTYLRNIEQTASQSLSERTERHGNGQVRLTKVEIVRDGNEPSTTLYTGCPVRFVFHVSTMKPGLSCTFTVYDHHGRPIANFDSAKKGVEDISDPGLGARLVCKVDEILLLPGRYRMNIAIMLNRELADHVEGAAFFDIEHSRLRGRSVQPNGRYGSVVMPHQWTLPK